MAYQFIPETQPSTKSPTLSLDLLLPPLSDTIIQPTSTIQKAHNAAEIFSSSSRLSTETDSRIATNQLSATPQTWQSSVFLALVLCYYLFIFYRHPKNILPILNISFSMKKTLTFFEIQNNDQINLTRHSTILSLLTISIYALSMTQHRIDSMLLPAIVISSVSIWFIYKFIILNICTVFSDEKDVFQDFKKIVNHSTSIFAIIATPIIIASAIDQTDSTIATVTMITLWIYYSLRILVFFVNNGFGGLQWFLYLCAVELLPISFAVAIATRYSEL